MIKNVVNEDYQNVQVVSNSLEKLDKLLTCMKRKIYESIGQYASVLDLYELVGVSFLDMNAEMMNWIWTSLEEAKIDSNMKDNKYVLKFPPAKKISMVKLNIFRGCGKTMTAMKMIEDICENTKLREEINSKIKKYSDMDHYGYRFVLEYQHQPCEKRYKVEYSVPFDSPCFLEFWSDEEVDKYYDEQETKARKELIDRVIKDIDKGDVETMPYKNFDTSMFEKCFIIDARDVMCKVPKIVKIETYNDRVVKVTFADGTFTKAVCAVNDTFNIDVGITVCVMKKMLGKDGNKVYNNMIRNCHKLMNEQENKKIEMKMLKEEIKNKQRKDEEKRKAGKQKAREEQIDIQKEAFIRAMQETGMVNNGR